MLKSLKFFKSVSPGESVSLREEDYKELSNALSRTKERMGKFFQPNQLLGRKGAIGCVSLEISQRCNLNCSLCYLSPNSNNVLDMPLQELFRRLEQTAPKSNPPIVANILFWLNFFPLSKFSFACLT